MDLNHKLTSLYLSIAQEVRARLQKFTIHRLSIAR